MKRVEPRAGVENIPLKGSMYDYMASACYLEDWNRPRRPITHSDVIDYKVENLIHAGHKGNIRAVDACAVYAKHRSAGREYGAAACAAMHVHPRLVA